MLAALAVLTAGCGFGTSFSSTADDPSCAPSAGPVTLDFWTWVPGIDKTVEVWNRANPDVQVHVVPMGDGVLEKMLNSVAAGQPPDLAQLTYDQVPAFRTLQALENLVEWPGVAAAKPKFVPSAWSQVTVGGDGVYAIPQDTGPMVLVYRKDILEQHGVPVPRTWEDFATAAAKLHEVAPDTFLAHFKSNTGAGWKVTLDDPPTLRFADFWQRLIDTGSVAVDRGDAWEQSALQSGRLAAVLAPVWYLRQLASYAPETAGRWAAVRMPQWDPDHPRAANEGGSTTVVLRGARHPAEAARFALWLNSDPQALAMNAELGGVFPATVDGQRGLRPSAATRDFFAGQDLYEVFRDASLLVDPDFEWGPATGRVNGIVADQVSEALSNGRPLRDAFIAADGLAVKELETQSQPVVTE